tara:strand:+ start:539 stop:865 length:327 start_codon:yes stop_codon:yes gene_type:complete
MVLKSTVAAPVAPDTVVNQPWSPSLIFQLKSSICMRTCLAAVSGAVLLHTRELRACRGYIEGNIHPLEGLVHVLTVLPAHQLSAQRENDGNSLCDMSRTDMTEPAPTP